MSDRRKALLRIFPLAAAAVAVSICLAAAAQGAGGGEEPRIEAFTGLIEATLKKGQRHLYKRRRYYLDEDSWAAAAGEMYDGSGNLWRVQFTYSAKLYDRKASSAMCRALEVPSARQSCPVGGASWAPPQAVTCG